MSQKNAQGTIINSPNITNLAASVTFFSNGLWFNTVFHALTREKKGPGDVFHVDKCIQEYLEARGVQYDRIFKVSVLFALSIPKIFIRYSIIVRVKTKVHSFF